MTATIAIRRIRSQLESTVQLEGKPVTRGECHTKLDTARSIASLSTVPKVDRARSSFLLRPFSPHRFVELGILCSCCALQLLRSKLGLDAVVGLGLVCFSFARASGRFLSRSRPARLVPQLDNSSRLSVCPAQLKLPLLDSRTGSF